MQTYVENVCNNAALMIENVPSRCEKDIIKQVISFANFLRYEYMNERYMPFETRDNEDTHPYTVIDCYEHDIGNGYIAAKVAIFYNGVIEGYEQRMLGFNYDAIRVFLRDPSREKANRFADNFKKTKLLIQVNGLEQYAIQEDMQLEPFFMIDFDRLEQIIKDYYPEVGEDVPEGLLNFIEIREFKR